MAHKHYIGEYIVSMNRGRFLLKCIDSVDADGIGYSAHKVSDFYDRMEVHQLQYILNGWGFAEWTVSKSQLAIRLALKDIIERHSFDHTWCGNKVDQDPTQEMLPRPTLNVFKILLGRLDSEEARKAFTDAWMLKYNLYLEKASRDEYDQCVINLWNVINAA